MHTIHKIGDELFYFIIFSYSPFKSHIGKTIITSEPIKGKYGLEYNCEGFHGFVSEKLLFTSSEDTYKAKSTYLEYVLTTLTDNLNTLTDKLEKIQQDLKATEERYRTQINFEKYWI